MPARDEADLARCIADVPAGAAKEAEAELASRLAPRIRLYGLRHLRQEAAAQDLVQEVLVITLEALRSGRVREPERLASFVLGTCRMVVAAHRRGERRREQLLAAFGEALAPPPPPAPMVDRERLVDCLSRLSERERTVIVETFYAERGADEIARELGTSAGNVRVVRHRGLARLQACLAATP